MWSCLGILFQISPRGIQENHKEPRKHVENRNWDLNECEAGDVTVLPRRQRKFWKKFWTHGMSNVKRYILICGAAFGALACYWSYGMLENYYIHAVDFGCWLKAFEVPFGMAWSMTTFDETWFMSERWFMGLSRPSGAPCHPSLLVCRRFSCETKISCQRLE